MKWLPILFVIFITTQDVLCINCECGRVYYQGEACECGKPMPYEVEVPRDPEQILLGDYGYKVDSPQKPPCEVKYNFDFHVEHPKQEEQVQLGSYGYKVWTPPQQPCEIKYNFDYQVETPKENSYQPLLQGLVSKVDKVMLQRQDCDEPVKGDCTCRSCHPNIETLKTCPQHGYLYQTNRDDDNSSPENNEFLLPIQYGSRYESKFNYPRGKRGVAKETLNKNVSPMLVGQMVAFKALQGGGSESGPSFYEYKKFNFEEMESQQNFKETLQRNKRSLPKIKTLKKGTLKKTSMLPLKKRIKKSIDFSYPQHKMSCSTVSNLQKREDMDKQKDEVLQYLPEIQKPSVQNHCPNCGGQPCPNCGYPHYHHCSCRPVVTPIHSPRPQYIEFNRQGHPISYNPRQHPSIYPPVRREAPRFVYDQLGHKYVEDNGNLKILPPDFVSYSPPRPDEIEEEQLYLNKIRHLLYSNPNFHKASTLKEGELTEGPIEQQRDVLKFLREIVKGRKNDVKHIPLTTIESSENEKNDDYEESNEKSSELGATKSSPTLTPDKSIDIKESRVRFIPHIDNKNQLINANLASLSPAQDKVNDIDPTYLNNNPRGATFFEEERNGKKLEIVGSNTDTIFKRSKDENLTFENYEKNSIEFVS